MLNNSEVPTVQPCQSQASYRASTRSFELHFTIEARRCLAQWTITRRTTDQANNISSTTTGPHVHSRGHGSENTEVWMHTFSRNHRDPSVPSALLDQSQHHIESLLPTCWRLLQIHNFTLRPVEMVADEQSLTRHNKC